MVYRHVGPILIRHNELHYLTAVLLLEVFHGVQVDPLLLPLIGESICQTFVIHSDEAHVDVCGTGFWSGRQS